MQNVTVKYIKPTTPFGMPEFFVQAPNVCPLTTWSSYRAAEAILALGVSPENAVALVAGAMADAEAGI